MFDLDGEATPAEILHSAAGLRRARIEVDNAVLFHAVAWADRNGPETIHPDQLAVRGGARPVQLGGDNTPEVNDLAPAELGAALGLSTGAAAGLVADSLDLRHRLPNLWAKICDCSFPGWQGRKIAQHTRALTAEQAAQVDRRLAGYAGTIAWTRLERFLDAVVADILGSRGHAGNADTRRATALGILADPIQTTWLLTHHTQPHLFDTGSAAETAAAAKPAHRRDDHHSAMHHPEPVPTRTTQIETTRHHPRTHTSNSRSESKTSDPSPCPPSETGSSTTTSPCGPSST